MFLPQVLRPLPAPDGPGSTRVARIGEVPYSVVFGPHGSYLAEQLAAAVQGWDRWPGCVWVRDWGRWPPALPGLLATACAHRWDAAPAPTGSRPEQLLASAPEGAVIVIEAGGGIGRGGGRLLAGLRSAAAERDISVVTVTEGGPRSSRRDADLRIAAAELAVVGGPSPLPDAVLERLRRLADGRPAVERDVLDAAVVWPADLVAGVVARSWRCRPMLEQLSVALLQVCTPGQRSALEVCATTGYWHPQLTTESVDAASLRPWVVPLETQWGWLRPVWARALARGLAAVPPPTRPLRLPTPGDGRSAPAPRVLLQARLLGDFELRVDGLTVTQWNGPRGLSVVRYLLHRPGYACPRDELLEEFWPGVGASAARNRLQVAVSGVRRALAEVGDGNVIEYADGGYRICSGVRVEVDVEAFEERASAGKAAERAGDAEGALARYHEAVALYRGHFAADAPYEQWTLLPREVLRIRYVDVLDRCARILLDRERVDECVGIGHRMLDVDQCREDAHRQSFSGGPAEEPDEHRAPHDRRGRQRRRDPVHLPRRGLRAPAGSETLGRARRARPWRLLRRPLRGHGRACRPARRSPRRGRFRLAKAERRRSARSRPVAQRCVLASRQAPTTRAVSSQTRR